MSARLKKILAYALDPAAVDGEAANAAVLFVAEARRAGLDVDGVAQALGRAAEQPGPQVGAFRVPPDELRLPFGKYRGWSLADVYRENPAYVRWFAANAVNVDPVLIRAAAMLVKVGEQE